VVFGNWKTILLESEDIALNRFADILYCFFLCFSLADASGQTGALGNPIPVFAWVKHNLTHFPASK